jgi:putative addiction module component (TIGR02574 family)
MSSATMDVSIDQLRQLPLEKRLEIIEALWESVEQELGPVPISDEFADELDRRYEEHLADPSTSVPWEQVRAEMRRRLADPAGEDSPGEMRLSQREQAEIDHRLAAHERDPGAARPVDAFLDELDRRYA